MSLRAFSISWITSSPAVARPNILRKARELECVSQRSKQKNRNEPVLVVKPCRWSSCNEELRSVGSRTRVRHADSIRTVMSKRRMELVSEIRSPQRFATCAISQRISCLYHLIDNHVQQKLHKEGEKKTTNEFGDNTMEDDLVVVPFSSETNKILHRLWDVVREKIDMDISFSGMENSTSTKRTRGSYWRRNGKLVSSGLFVENVAISGLFSIW